jgi:tetratricopeptide (TPR) repeat protein
MGSQENTSSFLELLNEALERVPLALSAWYSIRNHPMITPEIQNSVRGKLIYAGVWRRAVVELKTQSLVRENEGSLILAAQTLVDARIVKAFLNKYETELPVGMPKRRVLQATIESTIDEIDGQAEQTVQPSRRNAENQQDRAIREVDTISRLYIEGKDDTAREYYADLVDRQAAETNRSHLVKSLCNIASQCTVGGRHDVAAECLNQAVLYEDGVDSRLFTQMGNLFKDLKRFEQAAHCFQKAEKLANNEDERDLINLELARLQVAQGHYKEALRSFEQLSDVAFAPETRTSLATLYRKMGELRTARQIYEEVWRDCKTHQAYAGLAEVNRHTGRWYKAIDKYKWMLGALDIDERSRKIYQLSQSSLYKVIGNLGYSKSILNALYDVFPTDPSIQLSLAKVLRLMGDLKQSDYFFRQSHERLNQTERLATRLYETALLSKGDFSNVDLPSEATMPEFVSLTFCDNILRKIIASRVDEVDLAHWPKTVDAYKLHSDFKSVLGYHVRLALGTRPNPKGDQVLNRLRKRGLLELKTAVRALDNNDFDSAIAMEQQMCLKIA